MVGAERFELPAFGTQIRTLSMIFQYVRGHLSLLCLYLT